MASEKKTPVKKTPPKKKKLSAKLPDKSFAEFRDACSQQKKEKESAYKKQLSAAPVGRPTIYSPEFAKKIFNLISATTISIQRLTEIHDWMPARSTMIEWINEHPEFSIMWQEAKKQRAHLYVEEAMDISDDGSNDYMESFNKDGDPITKLNTEHIQRSKLRVDTRKWVAGKYLASIYGDTRAVETLQEQNEDMRTELFMLRQQLAEKSTKDY